MATTLIDGTNHTSALHGAEVTMDSPEKNALQQVADDAQHREAEGLEFRRRQFMEQTDKSFLSFDAFLPGEREAVRKQRLIRNVMDAEYDVIPQSSASYQQARTEISHKLFGQSLDDDSFFSKLQERAQTKKNQGDFQQELVTSAVLDAVSGGGLPYQKWNWESGKHVGREKFKDSRYLEQWNDTQSRIEDKYGDVLPVVRRMYDHLQGEGGESGMDFFYDLTEEERPLALNLLQMSARGLAPEQKATFLGNLKKQSGRDMSNLGRSAFDGFVRSAHTFSQLQGNSGEKENVGRLKKESGFRADLRNIIEQDYDPVRHLFPENTLKGSAERATYAVPGVIASSAMAITPIIGQVAIYHSMEESAFQDYRRRFMEAGLSEDEAMAQASIISPVTGAIQGGLERLGGKAIMGKLPVLDKTITKLSDKVTNRATRFGVRTMIGAGQETIIENLQDLSFDAVQDITHALNQDIPDVNWNEVFDGYAHKTLTTFLAVMPLSVFGAAGGISREKRNRAFSQATELELKAVGYSQESIKAIKSAEGDASLEKAIQEAQETLTPNSEEAHLATEELAERIQRQKELEVDAMRAGVLPRVRVKAEGLEVIDPQTEEVIALVDNADDALQVMNDHTRLLDKADGHRLLYLKSMIEGTQLTTSQDSENRETTVELRLDEQTTVAQASAESAQNAEQVMAQLEVKEQLGGGDGSMTQLVMGQSSTQFEGKQRKTLNRLNAGASILDVVHEEAHGLLREAFHKGRLTREEVIQFFRTIDQATGDKAQNFLPDGEVSEVALDEAVAEFSEVELLRTRKGEKAGMASIVNNNLSAVAQLGVIGNKFKSFISAMKQYFKTTLTRHLHIKQALRDGSLKEADLDVFRAKLQGTTQQEEFEGEVLREAESFMDNEPFSIGEDFNALPVVESKGEFTLNQNPSEYLKENYDGVNIFHPIMGEIALRGRKLRKLARTAKRVKMQTLPYLKEILENSVVVKEGIKEGEFKLRTLLASKFKHNGQIYIVLPMLEKDAQSQWYYNHELTTIKNLLSGKVAAKGKSNGDATQKADSITIFKNEVDVNDLNFSLGTSEIADALIGDITKRVRRPESRAKILGDIMRRLEATKRDTDKVINAFGKEHVQKAIVDPRTIKSLKKEAAFRQADARERYEMEVYEQYGEILENTDLTKLKEKPLHAALSDPNNPLKGRLLSHAQAKKDDLFVNSNAGDYDDMGMLSKSLFGGSLTPDQAARELFDDGLLPDGEISTLWEHLNREQESVLNRKEDLQNAREKMRKAREKAKAETSEWLESSRKEQERDHSPTVKIRRSLATLDAIMMALPSELRGKVGGYTQIAKLNSDEKRLEYLQKKIEKVDLVLDRWVADTMRKDIGKLFDRSRVKKDRKGIPKAKLAADYTDEIMEAEAISKLTKAVKESKIEAIQKDIDAEAIAGNIDKITELETGLAKLMAFGALDKQTAQETMVALENLQSLFSTGRMLKEALEEEFSTELASLKEIVNHDITGGKGAVSPDQAKRMKGKHEKSIFHGLNKFHRKNLNFEWLLNALSRENKRSGTLQSKTTKELGKMVHNATHEEKRGNMERLKRYNERMGDIFGERGMKLTKAIDKHVEEQDKTGVFVDYYQGGRKAIKKSLKAEIVRRLLSGETKAEAVGISQKELNKAALAYAKLEKDAKDGIVKDNRVIHYEIQSKAERVEKRLSQDQALNLSMLWKQEDLRESMKEEGFTEETMKQLEKFLTPESKQIRDFLRSEYYQNYTDLNAVFKHINGTNLPQNKNYSPAVRKADGVVQEMSIDSHGTSAMSTSPNFLISRVRNFAQVDQDVGALSLYIGHMEQSQHYISWAKSVKMLRSIFGDKQVKENIDAYAGSDLLSEINEKIEWFADGGNRKAMHIRWMDKLRTTFTYSSLAYNWGVAIKQLTSMPAYAWDMGMKDFSKYSLEFAKDPIENMKFIWNLDYTQARFKEGYERDVIEGLKGSGSWSQSLLNTGMLFGKAGDIVPVMAGGWVSYKRAFDKATADGMTKEQAHKEAVLTFEMSTDRAQQAGDLKDFSTFQGGGSIFKLFTMFKTSPTQYYRNVYESFLDYKAGKEGSGKEFLNRFIIGQIILPLTFQFASDAVSKLAGIAGDEDEFDGKDYLRAVLLGPLNGLFLAGDAAELLTSGLAGTKIWSEKITILDPFEKISKGVFKLKNGDFEKGTDDILRGIGKVAPSPITFYEIFRREQDKLNLD